MFLFPLLLLKGNTFEWNERTLFSLPAKTVNLEGTFGIIFSSYNNFSICRIECCKDIYNKNETSKKKYRVLSS